MVTINKNNKFNLLLAVVTLSASFSAYSMEQSAAVSPAEAPVPVPAAPAQLVAAPEVSVPAAPATLGWRAWAKQKIGWDAKSRTAETPATDAKTPVADVKTTVTEVINKWSNRDGALLVGATCALAYTGYRLGKCLWNSTADHGFMDKVRGSNASEGNIALRAALVGGATGGVIYLAGSAADVVSQLEARLDLPPVATKALGYGVAGTVGLVATVYGYKAVGLWWDNWKFYNLLISSHTVDPQYPCSKFRWSGSFCQSREGWKTPFDLENIKTSNKSSAQQAMINAVINSKDGFIIDYAVGKISPANAFFNSFAKPAQLNTLKAALMAEKQELATFLNQGRNSTLKQEILQTVNAASSLNISSLEDLKRVSADIISSLTSTYAERYKAEKACTDIYTRAYCQYVYWEATKAYARACVLLQIVDDSPVVSGIGSTSVVGGAAAAAAAAASTTVVVVPGGH
ncbi:MAG TPA: hypothetical protein VJJ81_01355 [Candidatus Babeliales bacterium]|nr:hypothetical protein [Candidatus Babeliales bacterium]